MMTLREQLERLRDALPTPASSVTLTRADLGELLGQPDAVEPLSDLTVEDVAAEVDRAPSTVRGWCHDGKLRAYRLNGREWRITRGSLRDFLRAQHEDQDADPLPHSDDLSSWREVAA